MSFHASRSERNLDAQLLQADLPSQQARSSFLAIPQGMLYPKELKKYEAQFLTYLTEPWDTDVEMVGLIQLHLALASIAMDTHIIARLSDITPQGSVRLLSFG